MGAHRTPASPSRPEITVKHWKVVEAQLPWLPHPSQHLVGILAEEGKGKVTSPIAYLDPEWGTVRTSKGRVYRIEGPPGTSDGADYALEYWRITRRAKVLADVTQYVADQLGLPRPGTG